MTTVYLVVYNDYGDQGVDPIGVFSTIEKADEWINNQKKDDPHWFNIMKMVVDND